jgi:hypothetical protein
MRPKQRAHKKAKNTMKQNETFSIQFVPALLSAVALIACSSAALGQSANQNQKTAPSLKLPAAPAPSKGTLDTSGTMPSAEEIFAKAVAASGGADLIRMQTARTQTGTIEMPAQSLKGTIVTKSVDPSMLLIETEIPGFGKIRQGANGTTGWSIDPMRGASIMSPEELKRVLRDSSIAAELNPAMGCDTPIVEGKITFAGTPCYQVKLKCGSDESTRFYSIESGHLVGSSAKVNSQMGEIEVTTSYKNFEAFSGRTLAKVQDNSMMGQTQILNINAVDFSPIDPAVFALPPEIQALVNAAKNPAPATPTAPPKPAKE